MGFDATNQTTLNNFNLPKKIFGDTSNTMNPASVPRKLRSAIKKRSCEPLSCSKSVSRLVNGVEPLRNDCLKKLKLSTQNGCSNHSPNGPALLLLSKDEEEVAETLSALAGLIPPSRIHMNDNMDCESKEENSLMPEPKGSVLHNEETNVGSHPVSYEETNVTIAPDGSLKESEQENSPTDAGNLSSWSILSERRQLNLNLQVSVPSENLIIPSLLRNCEMKEEQALLSNNEPHMRFGAVDAVTNHESQTGLTSRALHGFGVGLSLQPFAVMFPSWLNTATISSSGLGAREDNVSTDKVSWSINGSGKSWKKCATHVYISRLIQSLQTSERKDAPGSDASHLRPSQCVTGALDPPGKSNAHSTPVNHIRHHEQEGPSISGCCGSQKQGFDFLSLSAADNMEGKSFERGAAGHMDFLRSVGQNGALVSFSLQQNHLPSNSYQDQVGAISASQVHLPIPPYFSNPFGTSHMSSSSTTKTTLQPPTKPQQQQQLVWPPTLTAPFRPGSLLSSHITNWPNRRQNLQSGATHHMPMPPLIPTSSPSLGVLGAKYLHMSQQPLPLVGLGSSLPPLKAKSQHNQLPLHL